MYQLFQARCMADVTVDEPTKNRMYERFSEPRGLLRKIERMKGKTKSTFFGRTLPFIMQLVLRTPEVKFYIYFFII